MLRLGYLGPVCSLLSLGNYLPCDSYFDILAVNCIQTYEAHCSVDDELFLLMGKILEFCISKFLEIQHIIIKKQRTRFIRLKSYNKKLSGH